MWCAKPWARGESLENYTPLPMAWWKFEMKALYPMKREKLVKARRSKGLTQAELAEALGLSREAIGACERGQSHPYPNTIERLCTFFKMSAEALDLVDLGTPGETFEPVQRVSGQETGQQNPADEKGPASKEREVWYTKSEQRSLFFPPHRAPEVETFDMRASRRQVLHELLSNACMVLVLSPYTAEPLGVGLDFSALNDLERITESYWRLCQNASLDVLGSVTEHFRTITHQLKRKWSYEVTQRLCELAGETAQMLGKTLFDVHEYQLAWSYYTFSLKAAQAAGNHDLWAVGLGRMSLLLIYWEQPQAVLPLVQEARQLTIESPRIACWLAAVEAEVHARLKDADACHQALQEALFLLTSESLGEDRYATGMNPSRLAGYEGACFVRLRQPERALPALKQAAQLLDAQAVRRHSTILSDMAMAYAQQGKIGEACQSALQALTLTVQTRSSHVLSRVRLVREALEPWKETKSVQELEKSLDATFALITA